MVWLSVFLEHTFLLFTVENLSHVVFFFQTWNARYLLSLSPHKPLTNGLARYVWNLWGIKSVNLMIPWFVDLRYVQETNWRTVYFAANSYVNVIFNGPFPSSNNSHFHEWGLSQGAKIVSLTVCHSGKQQLACTSPQVISTSPQTLFDQQDWL